MVKKILLASVAVFLFDTIVGMLTCGWLFNWVYSIAPTYIWKSMGEAPPLSMYIGSFIFSIIFVCVYLFFECEKCRCCPIVKGMFYGLCVWGVGVLPGMFATYYFMTIAPTVILYWTLSALIFLPIKGAIVASIVPKESCKCT